MEKYEKIRSLRETIYGKVRLGRIRESNLPIVIKEYNKDLVRQRLSRKGVPVSEDAQQEIRLHHKLSQEPHPNVLRLMDICEDDVNYYVILEFCPHGELFSFVEQNGKLDENRARRFFRQIVLGVQSIHSKNICHRDISLENILLSAEDDELKICDFGVAAEMNGLFLATQDNRPGKYQYMAPELFALQPYDGRAADVWSCGVSLFIMCIGAPPFEIPTIADPRFGLIWNQQLPSLLDHWGLTAQYSEELLDLLQRIFSPQAERLTCEHILKHPWLLKHDSGASGLADSGSVDPAEEQQLAMLLRLAAQSGIPVGPQPLLHVAEITAHTGAIMGGGSHEHDMSTDPSSSHLNDSSSSSSSSSSSALNRGGSAPSAQALSPVPPVHAPVPAHAHGRPRPNIHIQLQPQPVRTFKTGDMSVIDDDEDAGTSG